jgi:hypothetical protein
MAAASSAVKIALAGLGPDDKPARANYSRPKAKAAVKNRASRKAVKRQ